MPEILRARSCLGLVAALLTVGLVASACGSDASETSAADVETTAAEETETTASETGAAADTETESTEGEATDAPEPATENLFPNVDVVNIVDGSTVNLAQELGGGDLPVLLWFWAPH